MNQEQSKKSPLDGISVMLAPMAGVTDLSMRKICAGQGAQYAVTEMVSAKALVFEQLSRPSAPAKTAELCRADGVIPTAVQIFGSEPEFMAEAARLISTGAYRGFSGVLPSAIDINMGCPVKKVVCCGEGSALMRDPGLIADIVSAVVSASSIPVTVKIRAGWDNEHKNAAECAAAAEAAGAAGVCVHARTRMQFYAPGIDHAVIGEVKARVGIPVIGNGDIYTADDAVKMKQITGCDGVAVARGAMGNPWLFAAIRAAFEGREPPAPPSAEEILRGALTLLHLTVADKGEKRGVAEAKVTISHYVRGLRGAAAARTQIMEAMTAAEMEDVLIRMIASAADYSDIR
ncbi:MAG: tRNA dihydrouridine synthase DusB [Clostridia bacterium]|nr:tRNA dihydrouridine synthase DusB [Clostridia bacterium]